MASLAPQVSVVLPARNAEATLGAALASLVAQTWTDWEALVLDDHSTDGTAAVAAAWSVRDPRLRVLRRAELGGRPGLVPALNDGLAAARGAFIARMDADDTCAPMRLGAQMELFAARPELGVVSCGVDFGGDRQARAGYAAHVDWLNGLVTPEAIALARFVEAPVAHPSVVFRKELVALHGGYRDGTFPEDYELWLRWLDAGVCFAKVPKALYTWNDLPGRLSRTDSRYSVDAFYQLKCHWLARWLQREVPGRPVWLWGAGRITRKRFAPLETEGGVRFAGYVDVDPRKIGGSAGGRPVIAQESLPRDAFVLAAVGARGARELIAADLRSRGFVEGAGFLCVA